MLIGALILVTTILSTNGYPYSLEAQGPYIDLQIPEQQQLVYQSPVEEQVGYQNVEQHLNQEPYDDYFSEGGSKLDEHQADFTISCDGQDKICTSKHDCLDGYIQYPRSAIYPLSAKDQQCRVYDQVCCTIVREQPQTFVKNEPSDVILQSQQSSSTLNQIPVTKEDSGQNVLGTPTQADFAIASPVQLGCAAALICVEEQFCTLDGTISTVPVTITEKQLFRRVPLSSCKNPDNGIIGKCCRDPNYVDPWPTGNLPANYSGGFDEQGFPTFLNIAKVKPPQKVEPTLVPAQTHISPNTLAPPQEDKNVGKDYETSESRLVCGVRNRVLQGEESKTTFAEIPWQAMVLHSGERKILCSGALIGTKEVLTSANCVDRLSPNDVSIKLGEWKLGYDLKHEEPLPFEIINVSSISIHPGYRQGLGEYDLAMVHLENAATLDRHINPLCLPEPTKFPNNKLCITTGWGKSILQAHYAGAVMHVVNMDVLSTQRCKEQLTHTGFETNIADRTICAATREDKNNVCETDVGGPLACQNENGHYELAGIYSKDTGCLATDQVAIFAPLDEKWLKDTMSQATPEESELDINVDYRKSSLATDNQYLPPY